MYLDEIYEKYRTIKSKLEDDKSKKLFETRIEYMISRDLDRLEHNLFEEDAIYRCGELDKYFDVEGKSIVLFGTGECAKKTMRNLELCQKNNIVAFCDNNQTKVGKNFMGLPVISFDELMERKDCAVIICSSIYGKEIRDQLIDAGYDKELILQTQLGYPEIQCGWQYFDVFEPKDKEIFVDAGSYDGSTAIDFWKWGEHSEKKVYSLEPVEEMYKVVCENLHNAGIDCVTYNCAAWNKNEPLNISIDMKADGTVWGGSAINENGSIVVQGKTIDSISEEIGEITFIKMDIEGSELAALEGAKNTIKKYAPRLAISLYHKPTDVIDIPSYILQLRDDYIFVIRHYSGNQNETVLYAYQE